MSAPSSAAAALRTRRIWRESAVNLMYLPAVALFVVFIVIPVVQGVAIALTNWDGYSAQRSFVGLDNFARIFTDENFATALRNTFIFGVGSTLIQQVLGLLFAVLLDRKFRGRGFARAVIYLPVLVSPVVMGTMYYLVFRYHQGALNDILGVLGIAQVSWLSDVNVAVAVIVLINSVQFMGVSMLIYLSGLQGIPAEIKEAASLDGATGWRQFFAITVPQLTPAFAASVVLNLIGGLKLYDIIQVLTGGGPGYATNSLSTLIGRTYFGNQAAGYAAAQGIVLFLIIVVCTIALNWWFDRTRNRLEN
ncbi:sugar ABC transporter permease [Microbacterium sp. 69-10]|uniref:carbohydrate ABC transporter permease n=1 Tax=Microbacterium sp. 69-10 TaxID=1895783 RepID=UPI0025EDE312|nr:sugar ABC transporter permease [Microbacterium sp. 69-10]